MLFKIELIGRLTKDAEMRYTPAGTAVTNLSIATSKVISKQSTPECPKGWKDSYNQKNWEVTTFWRVTVWGKQAEACNSYLSKGSLVYIEGEPNGEAENGVLNPRIWTDKDGQPRASWEVTARNVRFLNTRSEGSGGEQGAAQTPEEPEASIPF